MVCWFLIFILGVDLFCISFVLFALGFDLIRLVLVFIAVRCKLGYYLQCFAINAKKTLIYYLLNKKL